MKILALFLAAITWSEANAFAQTELVSVACRAKLEARILNVEKARLRELGEELASELVAETSTFRFPNRPEAQISVRLTDPADGRRVSYSAKALKADLRACRVRLERNDAKACRYSRPDGGPDALNEIPGLRFREVRMIKPTTRLSALEERQVRAFLNDYQDGEATISELIEGTDDKELSVGTLSLPGGRTLTYYGAYSGDTPMGMFFVQGTTRVAGDNGDNRVCIQ